MLADIPLWAGVDVNDRCDPSNRTDCGYYGIKEAGCVARGCCWMPVSPNPGNVPWCIFKSPPSPSCSTTPACSGHGSCGTGGTCQCSTGYATCGAVGLHDCDTNTGSDPKNCGSCGHACTTGNGVASSTCEEGSCKVTCDAGYSYCFGTCYKAANCSVVAPFSPSEMATMTGYFKANINNPSACSGCVLASPSKAQPDYYYHWQRDGAISIRELMNANTITEAEADLQAYVQWVRKVQFDSDPNGIDVRGEPKFFVDGSVYNGGWMRPQNDGAGLRTAALCEYAQKLIAAGQKDYVTNNIYNVDPSQPGIKRDLQYIVANWNLDSGDPWEEVRGQVFFEKFVSRRALILGAALCKEFGDNASAQQYLSTASDIESNIISMHWNAAKGIIMEVPQTRELDSATHLGFLYGYANDGFLGPTDSKVQSSVSVLVDSFASYTDFSINAKDTAANIPGLLVGRYLYDHYNGGNSSQPGSGNPWILCTASLAQVYYEAATAHAQSRLVAVDDLNKRFYEQAVEMSAYARDGAADGVRASALLAEAIVSGNTIRADSHPEAFKAVMDALTLTGDGILLRIRYHVKDQNFHLTEEINKDSGAPQGAQDLSWSYGTVIGAMASRANAATTIANM